MPINLLETPITIQELDIALKSLKNNKPPNPDGYSAEFLKRFWPDLGNSFLEYINYSHDRGFLSF